MKQDPLALGVDFGGTSVKLGVVCRGEVLETATPIPTQSYAGPDEIIEEVLKQVASFRERFPEIAAIGFGMPGFVHFEEGVVHNLTNVPGWRGFPLQQRLEQQIDLHVAVDNDANCMTFAEWKFGAGKGRHDLIAITLGTGVGGGVVANGQMLRGSRFGAGEVGQMSLDWEGRSGHYGNLGALEKYVGNREISQRAEELYALPDAAAKLSPQRLAELAREGDPKALQLWDEVARQLAAVLSSCCWLLNPGAIIIGGGVAKAGDLLFNPLSEHLFSRLSQPFREHLMILPARFGNEAGMVGAGLLALEQAGYLLDD
jgi:glucokinase